MEENEELDPRIQVRIFEQKQNGKKAQKREEVED